MEGDGWCEYTLHHPGARDAASTDALRAQCVGMLPELHEHLWHKEPIELQPEAHESGQWRLVGKTRFGEAIDDEWFLVALLRQLTAAISGLGATIQDEDGEFLLIEAGLHLPRWLTPDTAPGRIFLYAGALHIVPRPRSPAELIDIPLQISMAQALAAVRGETICTMASEQIQAAINQRIELATQRAAVNRHRFTCVLPVRAAQLLKQMPWIGAAAVEALCERDLVDMKAAGKMQKIEMQPTVTVQVVLPRLRYAQLSAQQFVPPRSFGQPPPMVEEPYYTRWMTGCKIACGLEMVWMNASAGGSCPAAAAAAPGSVQRDPNWAAFQKSLKTRDYFGTELEGSDKWRQLQHSAELYFVHNGLSSKSGGGNEDEQLVLSIEHALEQKWSAKQLQPEEPSADDPTDWLEMTPEGLEEMLKQGFNTETGEAEPSAAPIDQMLTGMSSLVTQVSSAHEGALFPHEAACTGVEEEEYIEPPAAAAQCAPDELKPVSLDASRFLRMLDQTLGPQEDGTSWLDQLSGDDSDDELVCGTSSDEDEIDADEQMEGAMGEMDAEIADDLKGGKELDPVQLDLEVVSNLLKSYEAQQGLPGPVSNILRSMGIQLPDNLDEDEKEKPAAAAAE